MTLIVDVLTRAARQVSITEPTSWITATAAEYLEIRDDFLRQTTDDLLDRVDWFSPIGSTTTIAGSGATSYSLPANFLRLTRDARAVYDLQLNVGAIPVPTSGDWVELNALASAGATRYYQVLGYDGNFTISLYPAPSSNLTVSYVTTNWMATSGGTAGSTFSDATDVLLFPARLVEMGIVWRWRERKGLDYADAYAEYQALLTRASHDARGMRVINMGNQKTTRWQDNVPATIP